MRVEVGNARVQVVKGAAPVLDGGVGGAPRAVQQGVPLVQLDRLVQPQQRLIIRQLLEGFLRTIAPILRPGPFRLLHPAAQLFHLLADVRHVVIRPRQHVREHLHRDHRADGNTIPG